MYLPPQKETDLYNTGFDESFVGEVLIVQSISKLNHIIIKINKKFVFMLVITPQKLLIFIIYLIFISFKNRFVAGF